MALSDRLELGKISYLKIATGWEDHPAYAMTVLSMIGPILSPNTRLFYFLERKIFRMQSWKYALARII